MGVSDKKNKCMNREKKSQVTSATSLMTRIQNGGRGYGKWESELFFLQTTPRSSCLIKGAETRRRSRVRADLFPGR